MPNSISRTHPAENKAYIITGPTSGIGRRTALDVAKHGTVVLVGRNRGKLDALQQEIQEKGGNAVSVVCDLSDISSVQGAAAEIVRLNLTLAGLVNNAGIMQTRPTKNARGWDMSYATNHLGPFVLTEALMPHLPDGANILFVVSAVEDPERKPAVAAGFRGARYISAEASARGEWEPGGSAKPGFDAYATSKQAILAATLVFARETPRLHINAIEPGFNPSTGLGAGDASAFVRVIQKFVVPFAVPLLMPFIKILSTSKRAAREITKILTDTSGRTGVYYDEGGHPMQGSVLVRDQKFQNRVMAETRSFLAEHSQ
ncbi:SDR family NAD(P)-dependent oxidoreductase [Granulicella arctica]|uniref:NAD(P)-dependent dehydrogenase (Short-subunit alcohol dehydrogenase family) n=1 Tax=Granulicella arctica TaxID=940613 RepID=A0A7Y9PIS0_9BACT|nr:SDR family NAD(P)-dependent oxidoreductase [Granulicella arctica]NYF80611.1 NAD(P)-dependent dehydrogenase (short-subunit alcohol dehydrogenase family) [Granulicella arctica]